MTNKYQQSYRGDFIYLGNPTHVRKIFVTKIQLHIAGSRIFRLFHVAACMYQLLLCIVPSVRLPATYLPRGRCVNFLPSVPDLPRVSGSSGNQRASRIWSSTWLCHLVGLRESHSHIRRCSQALHVVGELFCMSWLRLDIGDGFQSRVESHGWRLAVGDKTELLKYNSFIIINFNMKWRDVCYISPPKFSSSATCLS